MILRRDSPSRKKETRVEITTWKFHVARLLPCAREIAICVGRKTILLREPCFTFETVMARARAHDEMAILVIDVNER